MKVPQKVYLTLGGGLGDVFCSYFRGENGWKWLQPWKERYPHTKVSVLSATHNPQTAELLKYNPYIDHFKEFGWVNDGRPLWKKNAAGAAQLKNQKAITAKLKGKNPTLYISNEDKEVVDEIQQAGRFIFLHPFAGLKDREALKPQEYFSLVDRIIDNKKYNVVVIGATHKRTNHKESFKMIEEFNYERPGLFNLVNKTNARISMKLAQLADSFIGCWSAYSCAFWIQKKKSTVIIKSKASGNIQKKFGRGGRWQHRGDCRLVLVEKAKDIEKTTRQILQRISP
jgi:hypothetical protein